MAKHDDKKKIVKSVRRTISSSESEDRSRNPVTQRTKSSSSSGSSSSDESSSSSDSDSSSSSSSSSVSSSSSSNESRVDTSLDQTKPDSKPQNRHIFSETSSCQSTDVDVKTDSKDQFKRVNASKLVADARQQKKTTSAVGSGKSSASVKRSHGKASTQPASSDDSDSSSSTSSSSSSSSSSERPRPTKSILKQQTKTQPTTVDNDSSDSEISFAGSQPPNGAKSSSNDRAEPKTKLSAQTSALFHSSGDSDSVASDSDVVKSRTSRRCTRLSKGKPNRSIFVTGHSVTKKDEQQSTPKVAEMQTPTGREQKKGSRRPISYFTAENLATLIEPVTYKLEDYRAIGESRQCSVIGCDSVGHLGGQLSRHFTRDACPVYHQMDAKRCSSLRQEYDEMASKADLKDGLAGERSPQARTESQRRYEQQMIEERSRVASVSVISNNATADNVGDSVDRQRDLRPFASDFDLELFREARLLAAEDVEAEVRDLPDVKTFRYIQMGRFEMEVWYASPYPEEFVTLPRIHICEFCLKYVKSGTQMRRHASKCVWKHPPGDEIYRKDRISVFEVCGQLHKNYCQSLCLLAKCFLDHKTMFFHVEPFLFYVLTVTDSLGCHLVGYFSKEKSSAQNYNVSCILTLPPYQRQGFGRLLIDFSYLLSRRENKIGSPEKPLSDLGLLSYRSYWKDVILDYMCHFAEATHKNSLSLRAFCDERGINCNDIVSTLQWLGMIKYWRGQHVILKRQDLMAQHVKDVANRHSRPGMANRLQLCPSALKWQPYEETWRDKRHAEQIKRSQEESRSHGRSGGGNSCLNGYSK